MNRHDAPPESEHGRVVLPPLGSLTQRHARGAYFTPPAIAEYLAEWAINSDPDAVVLDPTCGEAVFLHSAAAKLLQAGADPSNLHQQVLGVDLHASSVARADKSMQAAGLKATLRTGDFFAEPVPGAEGARLPQVDAVLGNPPFIRFQSHTGEARRVSVAAALAQGVALPGTASSWAAALVHASAFLKPNGRLAMVVPAELLTVAYAEPVRRWLKQRFAAVRLVFFDKKQFVDAQERVVLLIASGQGGCDAFSLSYVDDAIDLGGLHPFDVLPGLPAAQGKWTDLMLTANQRALFQSLTSQHYQPLGTYGRVVLGTVTGANKFFCLSESDRQRHGLVRGRHVIATLPPGSKHLIGLTLTRARWRSLRNSGETAWMLAPRPEAAQDPKLLAYLQLGRTLGVPEGYKCSTRNHWWRPSVVAPPDLFITSMSHRYPRLIQNDARVTFVNSVHGMRLHAPVAPQYARSLPLLTLNSLTWLGGELAGRSYGGGVLKLEPTEATALPVPNPQAMSRASTMLDDSRARLERRLRRGQWAEVAQVVDEVLLGEVLGVSRRDRDELRAATDKLRRHRLGPASR